MPTPTVRVRRDHDPVTIYVHELMSSIILTPGMEVSADHPVVRQYPEAFASDVEDASAEPGRKRNVRRANSDD